MKYSLTTLLRDFDFACRILDNPENNRSHYFALKKVVSNFSNKHDIHYKHKYEYFQKLEDKIRTFRYNNYSNKPQ